MTDAFTFFHMGEEGHTMSRGRRRRDEDATLSGVKPHFSESGDSIIVIPNQSATAITIEAIIAIFLFSNIRLNEIRLFSAMEAPPP